MVSSGVAVAAASGVAAFVGAACGAGAFVVAAFVVAACAEP